VRVVIADDVLLVRAGIRLLLEQSGVEVVAETADADRLRAEVALSRPDAAIVDIRMPPTHTDEGLRAAADIRRLHRGTAVLVLSQYVDIAYARRLLEGQQDGLGYLLKQRVQDPSVLLDALDRVVGGGCVIDEAIVDAALRRPRAAQAVGSLSDREFEVLQLMAQGRSNAAIAQDLHLASKSVEGLVTSVFRTLGLDASADTNRRVLAVLRALDHGDA
jgi:DNA-binding NarL/FixJ family response regulator